MTHLQALNRGYKHYHVHTHTHTHTHTSTHCTHSTYTGPRPQTHTTHNHPTSGTTPRHLHTRIPIRILHDTLRLLLAISTLVGGKALLFTGSMKGEFFIKCLTTLSSPP
eukprot:NODE_5319_length_415_cov_91.997268_g4640_i0.p1 GENE.NODE_5319_length_415_cov_91.997268_g4640_i0~~NODE_5319_length_415_cov_91.997268_g4640_i0.p1  ORF type:complete len:109 (+),score=20.75 NODE_5319_length_415_cov_91.997268_g4640_i0:53-379(+)